MDAQRRVDRVAIVIAFLVATVSIASAVVAARAAVWSSTAGDLDSLVLQEAIERQQLEADLESAAAADTRLAARYDTVYQRATALTTAAAELRETDAERAARLDLDAQAEWAVDLALWPLFRTALPSYDADGRLQFDAVEAIASQRAAHPRMTELARSITPGLAAEAHATTTTLVGVAVLFVAALFAFTLAEVWPGRHRWAPLVVGVAFASGALGATVLTDPDTATILGAVMVASGVLLLASLASASRGRRAVVPAGDGGSADAPVGGGEEEEQGSRRFRSSVAVALAAATLLGAGVGYLQGTASDRGATATREAQDQALLALTEHARSTGQATTQVEVWSVVAEHRARAAGARQLARYLTSVGDGAGAADAQADAIRRLAAANDIERLTVISDDHPDGPAADPAFPGRFLVRQQEARAERTVRQDLANEASASWGSRGAAYVAVLATIAIAAYLLGLSLVLRGRRQRALFAAVGGGLVVAAVVAAGLTALEPDRSVSPSTADAIAQAFVKARIASRAARTQEDHAAAVAAYREVIRLHPSLARAHVELSSALFLASSPQTSGYSSVATLDAVRAGAAELVIARELGRDDLGTRGDLGFYQTLLGLAEPESGASAQAVEETAAALAIAPELPVLRFNHAAALLADGQPDAARAEYDRAIADLVSTTASGAARFDPYERAKVSAGAITDLELILASRADDPDIGAIVPELKAAIVVAIGDPLTAAARTSPARVSGLELKHDASELWWTARIDDFDPERDVLSVVWLSEDPVVPGWRALHGMSGPLRLGEVTDAGGFYVNGAAPDYFASQGYLLTSDPRSCVPDGSYRVELYLNGRLALPPVTERIDDPELVVEERPDLGLLFCRPAGWIPRDAEPGGGLTFTDAEGVQRMRVVRVNRPNLSGEAGDGEVVGVLDSLAADWPGAPEAIPGFDPESTYFMGLAHGLVQYHGTQEDALEVIGGSTGMGTVIAVALQGTAEWLDGEEASGILSSFLEG